MFLNSIRIEFRPPDGGDPTNGNRARLKWHFYEKNLSSKIRLSKTENSLNLIPPNYIPKPYSLNYIPKPYSRNYKPKPYSRNYIPKPYSLNYIPQTSFLNSIRIEFSNPGFLNLIRIKFRPQTLFLNSIRIEFRPPDGGDPTNGNRARLKWHFYEKNLSSKIRLSKTENSLNLIPPNYIPKPYSLNYIPKPYSRNYKPKPYSRNYIPKPYSLNYIPQTSFLNSIRSETLFAKLYTAETLLRIRFGNRVSATNKISE